LELKENKKIVISFEWNAKNKDLHFSFHASNDRSIESLTRYKQETIVLERELLQMLKDDALSLCTDVFNHTLDVSSEAESTMTGFQHFSENRYEVVTNYPDVRDLDGHVQFQVKGKRKDCYKLTLKSETTDSFRYRHNVIIRNNNGSVKSDKDYITTSKESINSYLIS
ncbi:hypothetical protein, partial [Maribacter sp.]|uniref:hypothetical protein n=1 Tax=Maribacter sp. TaxID=1897614 RepID=UPI0032968F9D